MFCSFGNPARLSFECDTIISNTLAANPTFSSFVPVWRLAGLASEHYTTLGTLKSKCVKKKGVVLGVSGSVCRCVVLCFKV